jgi:ArsR family transcriptional regulator
MLELLAGRYERAIGFDINHTMLDYARGKIERAGLRDASVRHGDLYEVALESEAADAVIMHQVLHFLIEPQQAIREAARILTPGGRLIIVDFAPHTMEFLRDQFAHERLGFAAPHMAQWLGEAGLELEGVRNLTPVGAETEGKLTVTVWTATRPVHSGNGGMDTRRRRVEA